MMVVHPSQSRVDITFEWPYVKFTVTWYAGEELLLTRTMSGGDAQQVEEALVTDGWDLTRADNFIHRLEKRGNS